MKTTHIALVAALAILFGDAGSANATLSGFVLHSVNLRVDTSGATSTNDNGSLVLQGLVNDNDTGGGFLTQLLSPSSITLTMTDAGSFNVSVTLTNCTQRGPLVRCGTNLGHGVATILPAYKFHQTYVIRLRENQLPVAMTGSGPLTTPVTVSFPQGVLTRTDDISACRLTTLKGGGPPTTTLPAASMHCLERP